MTAKTAEVIVKLHDQASGSAAKIANSLKGIAAAGGQVGKSSAELNKMAEALDRANAAAQKIGDFKNAKRGFSEANQAFREAQRNVQELGRRMAEADKPTKELERSYRKAQAAVKAASAEMDRQRTAFVEAKSALRGFDIGLNNLASAENRLKNSIEQTTAAMKRQAAAEKAAAAAASARAERRSNVAGALAGIGAGYQAKRFSMNAVTSAAEFDIATRKQREFVDVDKATQERLLLPQAKRIGQETQFTNTDIVKAQTKAMQGLPSDMDSRIRAEVGAGIIESVRNYALVMEADMEKSAEAIRSFLQTTNKDISSKEKAIAESTRATNLIVKMAKLGGMNDEDAQQFMKYAAGTATAAGLSDTTLAALGAVGRRGGLRGDELGVFVRSASSKLVAPTSKGLDALTAAGINFNDFTKMPGGLSVDNMEAFSKRRFGKGFSGDQRQRIADLLENGDVVTDRGRFTEEVSKIVAESFDKKKDGKNKAQDAQKIAKMVGDFHKLSTESVDSEGLLRAIMQNPKMSIALLNAMFTDKHGGKAAILANMFPEFKKNKAELDKVTEDPGFAQRKADEIMAGLGGELERLKGSVQNLTLAFGEANAGWLQVGMKGLGAAMDAISGMSEPARQAATALGLAGAAVAAGGGIYALSQGFGLKGSAVALTGAAGALEVAAAKLGAAGGLPGGDVPGGGKGKPGLLGRLGGGLARFGGYALGAVTIFEALDALARQSTPRGNQYRNNTAFPDMTGAMERSRRAQDEWKRDPEAARGRAMSKVGAGVAVSEANVGGDSASAGQEAGQKVGEGIKSGLAAQQGEIEGTARAIMSRLKQLFAEGVNVPVRPKLEGGGAAMRGIQADTGID